jgi:preprotein translocase subunit SecF
LEPFRGRKWDLVGLKNWWFSISGITIVVGLYFLLGGYLHLPGARGLNVGIDFTGGGLLTYDLKRPIPILQQAAHLARIRRVMREEGIRGEIQLAGSAFRGRDRLIVRTRIDPKLSDQQKNDLVSRQAKGMERALNRRYPGITLEEREIVGGVVSAELIKNALLAAGLGSLGIIVWVAIRYDFKFSLCAMAALAHDLLVIVGFTAMLYREVNAPFVAVLLTVLGYSVHDTIVIFDRIRENVKLRKGRDFAETTNISLLETMPRSVNTVLSTELTLLALFFLGGSTLRDFVLTLLVGITSGAYSSIFNASQLLVVWRQREEKRLPARRVAVEPKRPVRPRPEVQVPVPVSPIAQPANQASSALPQEEEEAVPVASAAPAEKHRPRPKPKARPRKRKRRF